MATAVVRTEPYAGYALSKWTGLANGESGDTPTADIMSGDRVAQITGTFGAGGTIIMEGSVDGTTWFQLRDPSSTVISFTAAGGKAILEAVPFIRPRVTAGDGTTALTCQVSTRRN